MAKNISTVTPEVLEDLRKNGHPIELIDVRTPGECENGVIDGAININFQASDFEEKIASLDKTKPTLVYCAGGVRSAQAAKKMSKMGFVQIIDLKGGYSSWYE